MFAIRHSKPLFGKYNSRFAEHPASPSVKCPKIFISAPTTPSNRLKVPPHSIQAEQSVLGGLMLDNQTWDSVADKVVEEDFYRRDHKLIFRAIAQLAEKQDPFDVITLSEALEATGELQNVGGLAYLGMLVKDTPSAANIVAYANIVRDRSVLRQLIHVGTDISDSAFNTEGRETADLLENAERRVFEIAEQRQRGQGGFSPSNRCWPKPWIKSKPCTNWMAISPAPAPALTTWTKKPPACNPRI